MNPMRLFVPLPTAGIDAHDDHAEGAHDDAGMTRRMFLKVTAGAGLTLAVYSGRAAAQAAAGKSADPGAFVRIGNDDTVTVVVKHLEMGQGTFTGLPTLVAEELDAAWSQIRAEAAPADASRYNNLSWGPAQGTGGSSSLANSFIQYRQAGAAARAMLVAAAAQRWNVDAKSVSVKNGVVTGPGGKHATFGELASAAARQAVPADVKLKDPADFVYIGKAVPRTDSAAKSNGTAMFTQDVKLPGMLTAVVQHPPRFGARVKSFDSDDVSGVPGVRYVIEVPNGVAVVATSFWAAKKGRDALKVEWDPASGFKGSMATPPRRSPQARSASMPNTCSRTSRTRRWSRSIAWSSCPPTAARSGTASSSTPATSSRSRSCSASNPSR
jgi:isoquinoline 1-oxidoreductase beta subunit